MHRYKGRATHRDVEQQLLVGIANQVRCTRIELLLLEYALERVLVVLVEAVHLERVEHLEERRLAEEWSTGSHRACHRENDGCALRQTMPLQQN